MQLSISVAELHFGAGTHTAALFGTSGTWTVAGAHAERAVHASALSNCRNRDGIKRVYAAPVLKRFFIPCRRRNGLL